MSSIAIVTDTDSSLPADVAARYAIRQVPITVHFGEEMFRTGVDINDAQLFARVNEEGKLPTTSAPSPGDFGRAYQEVFDAGAESLICFCVSSEVSATYQAAVSASELLPDRDITVVDSRSLSLGQGYMVLAAAEAAEAGASKEEILAHAESVRDRTHLFAALSTLKYLAMSGRVGHLAAGMASLLSVKPILTIRDGKLDMLERVRTQHKAWGRVIELADGVLSGRAPERMAIIHVDALDDVRRFQEQIRAQLPYLADMAHPADDVYPHEIMIAELGAGLSVHAGAGLVGVTFVAAEGS